MGGPSSVSEGVAMNPFEILNSPQMLHAAVVHLPVAFGVLGVLLVFVCAITQMKNAALRWLTCLSYLLMALAAFGSVVSGEATLTGVSSAVAADIRHVIDMHEFFASNVWIFAVVTALLVVLCGVKSEQLRAAFTMLTLLASIATAVWVIITAQYGATLVYKHGIGTPAMIVGLHGPTAPAVQPGPPQTDQPPATDAPAATSAPPPNTGAAPPAPAPPPLSAGRTTYSERLKSMWDQTRRLVWPGGR